MATEVMREPNIKDQSLTKQLDKRMLDFVNKLRDRIYQVDIDGTETWRTKMITAKNQRQGIKRVTNTPYPGAPDIPLPETDKLIRKHKPNYVLSAVSGKTVMTVQACEGSAQQDEVLKEKVRKAGIAMNYLFQSKIPWVRRLTLAADRICEKGHAIFKIVEKYTSRMVSHTINVDEYDNEQIKQFKVLDKESKIAFLVERYGFDMDIDYDKETVEKILKDFSSGKDVIQFETEEVFSLPDILVPNPEKIFVAPGTGAEIENSNRITHEYFLPESILLDRALKNIYIKENVDKAIKARQSLLTSDKDTNTQIKEKFEGIDQDAQGEYYRIHEVECWYQPKDNEPFERWVFTFLADVTNDQESVIQYMPFNYEFEGWNYIKHDNEIVDDRYYASRGIPEQIRAIQEFGERAINNMLIRDEINNAPMFTVLKTSGLQSNQIRFIPGQKIPVGSHDEIRPLVEGRNVDVSSIQISQILKAYGEEYLGSSDQLFRNATNAGGGKTLGEIELGTQMNQYMLNLDIINWLETLRKVYTKVFLIMKERLIQPLVINGESITREDFNFTPDIRPSGSLDMADKQLQLQKATQRLGLVRQAKIDGVATLDDVFEAYKDYLEKDGIMDPNQFLTSPQEILQDATAQMEQKYVQMTKGVEQMQQLANTADESLQKSKVKLKEQANVEQAQRQTVSRA